MVAQHRVEQPAQKNGQGREEPARCGIANTMDRVTRMI